MKNKQHKKLDEMLKLFVTKEHIPINKIEEKSIEEFDENWKEKTDKLIRDGYIIPNENVNSNGLEFLITFEGKIFFEKGGYISKLKAEKRKKIIDSLHQWILTIGSLLAGFYVIFQFICYLLKIKI